MEQEQEQDRSSSREGEAAEPTEPVAAGNPDPRSTEARPTWSGRQPTILTLQDLIDLPRQILPEETYAHLRNATREAALAAFSLWRSIDRSRKQGSGKARTRIDVD
ncbi:MAG TPA: hypothetical protein VM409_03880 [Chloroflexia bacterium]|nr:hypothetical protein [Chloroflexia bacterium]